MYIRKKKEDIISDAGRKSFITNSRKSNVKQNDGTMYEASAGVIDMILASSITLQKKQTLFEMHFFYEWLKKFTSFTVEEIAV